MSHPTSADGLQGNETAICGMAGRFPGAADIGRFWENLCAGVESIARFGARELVEAGEEPEKLADPRYVRARAILDDVERFDAGFFGFSPREAEILDPQQRLFLECAYNALEDAGCDTERYPRSISLFAGAGFSNYLVHNLYGNRPVLDAFGEVQATIFNTQDSLTTMAGYKLNLRGPCCAVQTFCSTSLVAVHMACQSLLGYESDMALAGGSSVYVPQRRGYLYEEGGIVSPDGHCRAFDARAGGTVFGSGVGVVVLMRLADALAEGYPVRAVIRGSATNNDGSLKVSYAAPGVNGQTRVVVEALAASGVDADTIGYVEAHGTGTLLGDPAEVTALTKAFRRTTKRRGFCALGSVKTNVGHLDAAAGVTGLIKTVLCLERGQIPPSLHLESPNPQIDFTSSPFYVSTQLERWDPKNGPRRAGVSAFGVGGTNAHLVLEQAPPPEPLPADAGPQLLLLSAKTGPALDQAIANLAAHLRSEPAPHLADLAWTLQVGRRAFGHRWAAVCGSLAAARDRLEALDDGRCRRGLADARNPPVVFLLPDGPAPRPGTGRALFEQNQAFRGAMERSAAAARARLGEDVVALLYAGPDRSQEAASRLSEPAVAAAALFALEYALVSAWRGFGVTPETTVARGVGEQVAACLAGSLSLEDAIARAAAVDGGSRPEVGTRPDGGVCLFLGPGEPTADDLSGVGAGREVIASLPEPEERSSSVVQLLDALGRLWLAGVQADWSSVHAPARRRRLALPGYAFQRERHWVLPLPESEPGLESSPGKATDPIQWLHQPVWKRSLVSFGVEEAATGADRWLVLADRGGVGTALAGRLAERAGAVVVAEAGSAFGGDPRSGYRVDVSNPDDYDRLLEDLHRRDLSPTRVVHLLCLDPLDPDLPESQRFDVESRRGLYSVLHLLQALGRSPAGRRIELTVVSRGIHDVLGHEPLEPSQAPLLALCLVAPQEHHGLRCHGLDLEVEGEGGDPQAAAKLLQGELGLLAREPVVAYRGSRRWTRAIEPLPVPAHSTAASGVRDGGTYLLTGGFGNVAFVVAAALARMARVRLVLVGRSAVPPRDQWEAWLTEKGTADPTSRRIRRVRELESGGAEVVPVAADVTDAARMKELVADLQTRFGGIDGVVHAAGSLGPEDFGPLQDLSPEACERTLAAKVRGLLVLEALLADNPPAFWLLTSSLSGLLGGIGYAAYAAGNLFLDHLAAERNRRGPSRFISVAFDQWQFGGPQPAAPGRPDPGRTAIRPQEGLQLVERLLGLDVSGPLVVSATPLESRIRRWVDLDERPTPPPAAAPEAASPTLRPRPDLVTAFVPPRDQAERRVAELFEGLLGVGPIGADDDFFALGGHSLFAARALSRIRDGFSVSIPLEAFFETPTAAGLALRIAGAVEAQAAGRQTDTSGAEARVEIEL